MKREDQRHLWLWLYTAALQGMLACLRVNSLEFLTHEAARAADLSLALIEARTPAPARRRRLT